jgi:CDP-4-dehydro-6-deoxyglucose reductase
MKLNLSTAGLARALATEPVDRLDVMDDMLKVMSAQVTVRPSGRQFTVQGHDSLLQAGLHAGLKLDYGCGNGTCGMCKVRVISGEVARLHPTDYRLSEAERAQGYMLLCAHTAASSELTLQTLEAEGPQDIAPQQIVATVRQVRPLAGDTWLLHLQTPRSHRLRFLAGQSVTLGVAGGDGGPRPARVISSCPCDDQPALLLPAIPKSACAAVRGRDQAGRSGDDLGPYGSSRCPNARSHWSSPPATPASRR